MFDTSSAVEHLSLTLSVGTVPSITAAIAHINEHGSHH
jgi:glutamate-5-semialdehyde dehydrogenase